MKCLCFYHHHQTSYLFTAIPLALTLTGNRSNFSGTYNLSVKIPPTSKIGARRRKRSSDNPPPLARTPTFTPRINPSSPSHETPASSYDNLEQSTPQPPSTNGVPSYDTPEPSYNHSGPLAPDYESYGPPASDYEPYGPPAPDYESYGPLAPAASTGMYSC